MKYQSFIFKDYAFDAGNKTLSLHYSYDDIVEFTETYKFDFDFIKYDTASLHRAIKSLFFLAGVSYYKAYLPEKIEIRKGAVSQAEAAFISETYQKGLGELFYVNKLNPHTEVRFPVTKGSEPQIATHPGSGLLIGIGGGKDSLVSVELLRNQPKVATWSVGHRQQLEPLVNTIGLTHLWVDRQIDKRIIELNAGDAYNGHVPISAILAAVGVLVAVLSGYQDVVVSNENSANEPTLEYDDVPINHQYSKSLAFEQVFQEHVKSQLGNSVRYFSLLRPLSELSIAEQFSRTGFEKYKNVFSSCNRAFTQDNHKLFWDGTCPKCAFIFLALTPFLPKERLVELFSGNNLLLNTGLEPTYRQLLGIEGNKPLECVGEIKESRAAMRLAQQIYPELTQYNFELPIDYNYRQLSAHSMPVELYQIVQATFSA